MDSSNFNLLKIKRESLILLQERGYTIPASEADILNGEIRLVDFENRYSVYKNDLTHPLSKYINKRSLRVALTNVYNRGREMCLVYFAESDTSKGKRAKQVSSAEIANFCRAISDLNVDEAIIISTAAASPTLESLSIDICARTKNENIGVFIQHFMDDELMFNPLNNVFVPKHRILTDEELDEIRRVDKNIEKKLPQISAIDPVCKRLGARPNNVLEIERKVLTEKTLLTEEIAYRFVTKPQSSRNKK